MLPVKRSTGGWERHIYGGVARQGIRESRELVWYMIGPAKSGQISVVCPPDCNCPVLFAMFAVCLVVHVQIARRYKPIHRSSSARHPAVTARATSPETTLPIAVCPAVREPTNPRVNLETDRIRSLSGKLRPSDIELSNPLEVMSVAI
jgi:hypothetical protein